MEGRTVNELCMLCAMHIKLMQFLWVPPPSYILCVCDVNKMFFFTFYPNSIHLYSNGFLRLLAIYRIMLLRKVFSNLLRVVLSVDL